MENILLCEFVIENEHIKKEFSNNNRQTGAKLIPAKSW